MIDRMQLGRVPEKPHTVFEPDGKLAYEECFTRQGFDGSFSILYHRNAPTAALSWKISERGWKLPEKAPSHALVRRHFVAPKFAAGGRMIDHRLPVFFNRDVTLHVARPDTDDDAYFANGDGDELHFIHEGSGHLDTIFGRLPFVQGDYVFIPRAVTHRWHWAQPGFVFTTEAHGYLDIPQNFRTPSGQLKIDAPYSHRDFGRPEWPAGGLDGSLANGPRTFIVKRNGQFNEYEQANDPMDIVGWDGFVWPFTFNVAKYQVRTGLVHLPPPAHTAFVGRGFVVCNFVPRMTDTHPKAVPCPYPHSSPDCDEVIFDVRGNFTSRKGVGPASMSFHPAGIIHGPHPGAYEASIGTTSTTELAVMVDTFVPLDINAHALAIEDGNYMASWHKK